MKKRISIIFICTLLLSLNIFAYDFLPSNISINFPSEISIDERYPARLRETDGKGYQLVISKNVIFQGHEFTMYIRCHIDDKQIPYSDSAKKILQIYYLNEDKYDLDSLIYDDRDYFDNLANDQPFSESYRSRYTNLIDGYESDILYSQDGIRIERDYSWFYQPEPGIEDKLTYYFKSEKGLYSEYIIEISNVWEAFWKYRDDARPGEPKILDFSYPGSSYISIDELYSMTNEELDDYPDQNDPSIQLMHLLNEAMTTFRFKDRPNIPDSNLGTVSSDRVRMRGSYDLDSDILGHVNTGEEVIVMERSPEKQAIGDMYDYWYRVVSKTSFIKGWMYGAFLDLEE